MRPQAWLGTKHKWAFFLDPIFLSLTSLTQHNEKINSRRRGLTGWRSWRARSQFLKRKDTEVLFLVVRRNIQRDLLVVHEEKKISSIVMIQSSRSSYRGYIHRFWYLGKLMNLIYHEIVFFNFHSWHIRKLFTLSFSLAWEGLLI